MIHIYISSISKDALIDMQNKMKKAQSLYLYEM
jgi:hypothetical protein